MANGDTKTNQYLDIAANGSRADLPADSCCDTRTQSLIRDVAERIMNVEDEVERLENNPDVVDIVATYADLQAYDTSTLTDKDIIRVLEDSTHNNNSTYYRWNANTNQFDFVGEISGGSSINVVQSYGSSTTDVMSQSAVTGLVYDGYTSTRVKLGNSATAWHYSAALGSNASANYGGSVALGAYSSVSNVGEVNIGTSKTDYGYNNTNYRLLSGVHDGQGANDAVTVAQVNDTIDAINTALSTNIPHIGATS